jgi:hypothetical protein
MRDVAPPADPLGAAPRRPAVGRPAARGAVRRGPPGRLRSRPRVGLRPRLHLGVDGGTLRRAPGARVDLRPDGRRARAIPGDRGARGRRGRSRPPPRPRPGAPARPAARSRAPRGRRLGRGVPARAPDDAGQRDREPADVQGSGVGWACDSARRARKRRTGSRHANRRRLATLDSTSYSGSAPWRRQGRLGRGGDGRVKAPCRLRQAAAPSNRDAVSERSPLPSSRRRPCHRAHSTRRDSWRGTAGDSPRRSRTAGRGGSPS